MLGQFLLNFMCSFKAGMGVCVFGGGFYLNGPGHMTKMAATSIYGINLKRSRSFSPVLLA